MMGGLPTRTWTSLAPALRSMATSFFRVVPLTMLSSTIMMRLPLTVLLMGFIFMETADSLCFWSGMMKVLSAKRFFMKPSS